MTQEKKTLVVKTSAARELRSPKIRRKSSMGITDKFTGKLRNLKKRTSSFRSQIGSGAAKSRSDECISPEESLRELNAKNRQDAGLTFNSLPSTMRLVKAHQQALATRIINAMGANASNFLSIITQLNGYVSKESVQGKRTNQFIKELADDLPTFEWADDFTTSESTEDITTSESAEDLPKFESLEILQFNMQSNTLAFSMYMKRLSNSRKKLKNYIEELKQCGHESVVPELKKLHAYYAKAYERAGKLGEKKLIESILNCQEALTKDMLDSKEPPAILYAENLKEPMYIPQSKARYYGGFDEQGDKKSKSAGSFGNHLVLPDEKMQIFVKPQPEGMDPIRPGIGGDEYNWYQGFSPDNSLICAPGVCAKIEGIKTSDNYLVSEMLNISYGVNDDLENNIIAVSGLEFVELYDANEFLKSIYVGYEKYNITKIYEKIQVGKHDEQVSEKFVNKFLRKLKRVKELKGCIETIYNDSENSDEVNATNLIPIILAVLDKLKQQNALPASECLEFLKVKSVDRDKFKFRLCTLLRDIKDPRIVIENLALIDKYPPIFTNKVLEDDMVVDFVTVLLDSLRFSNNLRLANKLLPETKTEDLIDEIPKLMECIDLESFASLIIPSFGGNAEDGKWDNYHLFIVMKNSKVEKIIFNYFDVDRRTELPFITNDDDTEQMTVDSTIPIQNTSLYFLPLMDKPIPERTKEFFRGRGSVLLWFDWLRSNMQREKINKEMELQQQFVESDLREFDPVFNSIEDKVDLPARNTGLNVIYRLHVLSILEKQLKKPNITLNDLLREVEPLLYKSMAKIKDNNPSIKDSQTELFARMPLAGLFTSEELEDEEIYQDLEAYQRKIEGLLPRVLGEENSKRLYGAKKYSELGEIIFSSEKFWEYIPTKFYLELVMGIAQDFPQIDTLPLDNMTLSRLLYLAVKMCHPSAVKLLLASGADVNYVDPDGRGEAALHAFFKNYSNIIYDAAYDAEHTYWYKHGSVDDGQPGHMFENLLINKPEDADEENRRFSKRLVDNQCMGCRLLAEQNVKETLFELLSAPNININHESDDCYLPLYYLVSYALPDSSLELECELIGMMVGKGADLAKVRGARIIKGEHQNPMSAISKALENDNKQLVIQLIKQGAGCHLSSLKEMEKIDQILNFIDEDENALAILKETNPEINLILSLREIFEPCKKGDSSATITSVQLGESYKDGTLKDLEAAKTIVVRDNIDGYVEQYAISHLRELLMPTTSSFSALITVKQENKLYLRVVSSDIPQKSLQDLFVDENADLDSIANELDQDSTAILSLINMVIGCGENTFSQLFFRENKHYLPGKKTIVMGDMSVNEKSSNLYVLPPMTSIISNVQGHHFTELDVLAKLKTLLDDLSYLEQFIRYTCKENNEDYVTPYLPFDVGDVNRKVGELKYELMKFNRVSGDPGSGQMRLTPLDFLEVLLPDLFPVYDNLNKKYSTVSARIKDAKYKLASVEDSSERADLKDRLVDVQKEKLKDLISNKKLLNKVYDDLEKNNLDSFHSLSPKKKTLVLNGIDHSKIAEEVFNEIVKSLQKAESLVSQDLYVRNCNTLTVDQLRTLVKAGSKENPFQILDLSGSSIESNLGAKGSKSNPVAILDKMTNLAELYLNNTDIESLTLNSLKQLRALFVEQCTKLSELVAPSKSLTLFSSAGSHSLSKLQLESTSLNYINLDGNTKLPSQEIETIANANPFAKLSLNGLDLNDPMLHFRASEGVPSWETLIKKETGELSLRNVPFTSECFDTLYKYAYQLRKLDLVGSHLVSIASLLKILANARSLMEIVIDPYIMQSKSPRSLKIFKATPQIHTAIMTPNGDVFVSTKEAIFRFNPYTPSVSSSIPQPKTGPVKHMLLSADGKNLYYAANNLLFRTSVLRWNQMDNSVHQHSYTIIFVGEIDGRLLSVSGGGMICVEEVGGLTKKHKHKEGIKLADLSGNKLFTVDNNGQVGIFTIGSEITYEPLDKNLQDLHDPGIIKLFAVSANSCIYLKNKQLIMCLLKRAKKKVFFTKDSVSDAFLLSKRKGLIEIVINMNNNYLERAVVTIAGGRAGESVVYEAIETSVKGNINHAMVACEKELLLFQSDSVYLQPITPQSSDEQNGNIIAASQAPSLLSQHQELTLNDGQTLRFNGNSLFVSDSRGNELKKRVGDKKLRSDKISKCFYAPQKNICAMTTNSGAVYTVKMDDFTTVESMQLKINDVELKAYDILLTEEESLLVLTQNKQLITFNLDANEVSDRYDLTLKTNVDFSKSVLIYNADSHIIEVFDGQNKIQFNNRVMLQSFFLQYNN